MSGPYIDERSETRTAENMSTADLAAAAGRSDAGTRELNAATTNTTRFQDPNDGRSEPLFAHDQAEDFRHRWHDVQTSFVDEPRDAVKKADELVASVIKRLAEIFAEERNKLEHEWDKGENVSTEDLRIAMRRYRSFFDRLLSV